MTPLPPSRGVGRAKRSRLGRLAAAALTVFAAGAVLVAVPTGPVAAQSVPSSGGVVVIANGWSSADVGAAAPLAGRLDASVLYASASSLGDATEQALEQLAPSRVILVGGTGALKARVSSEVRRLLPDARVTRHNGSDRIDTAAKAALSAPAVPRGRPVVIANGWSPSDVGAAAPLAASLGGSLLFANRNSLGDPTVTALNRLGPSKVIIVGGTAALSTRIETELAGVVAGVRTQRLGGSDRVDTAARGAELADVGLGEPVVLANGWSAADVGIAAPLAAALDGSVLFTGRSALGVRTARALERLSPSRIILVGASTRLAETLDAELERLRPGTPRVNVVGPDRISTAALAALFAVEFNAEQQRFEDAVSTIAPGGADCDAAPQFDVADIDVVDPPADLNDPTAPLTVAEVVRIAGGCALVDYVMLDGRTVAEIRNLLADEPTVFAVGEPLRGFEPNHDTGAHSGYAPDSGSHYDDGAGEQWHLPADYMEQLWDGWDSANPITVAVIDTGVDVTHPDLDDRIADDPLGDCHDTDTDGHGTHVAGIIAAEKNDQHVAGVAPQASILPIGGVVTGTTCVIVGAPVAIIDALNRSEESRPKVINMSFGADFAARPPDDSCGEIDRGWRLGDLADRVDNLEMTVGDLTTAIDNSCDAFRQVLNIAEELNVVAVAAAGNCFESCDAWTLDTTTDPATWTEQPNVVNALSLPAAFDTVIAVAAVGQDGNRSSYSSAHDYVDIAAPGGNHDPGILSTVPLLTCVTNTHPESGSDYWSPNGCGIDNPPAECDDVATLDPNQFNEPTDCAHHVGYASGTSMASPFVAGVVAHMLNRHPDATPEQVRLALAESAQDRGDPGKDDEYGHGIVQPLAAIDRLGEILAGVNVNVREDTPAPSLEALDVYQPGLAGISPPISLQPTLSPETTSYTATVPAGTSYVTVEARTASGFRLEEPSSPPDADPGRPGYQVRLDAQIRPPSPDSADKPGTSAAVGERFLEVVGDEWSGSVIVASSENFPDGLAAASLAGALRAPILLTPRDRLARSIADFVRNEDVTEVVIMGGGAAVSESVERALGAIVGSSAVTRLWGPDRYETALRIAERVAAEPGGLGDLCGTDERSVFIATGSGSADALATSPAAYAAKTPVLLVDPNARTLHNGVRAFIRTHGIEAAVILGGTGAVPEHLRQELLQLSSINRVPRVAGDDRFETAAQLATEIVSKCYDNVETIGLANGQGFADALAAGPLTAELKGVMLLTGPDDVPPATLDAMTQIGKEAQLVNITLALLAVGDIAEADNAVTEANNTAGQQLHGQPTLGPAIAISTGLWYSCGIRTSGTVQCWGDNSNGESDPPSGQFTAIDAGIWHSCGIRTNGTAQCWGQNALGESDPPSGQFTGPSSFVGMRLG